VSYTCEITYIGALLSDNHYKLSNHITTNPITRIWMLDLEEKIKDLKIPISSGYYIIEYEYFFTGDNHPDLSNLKKVSNDAIKHGLGVDDKYFITRDMKLHLYQQMAKVKITIKKAEGVLDEFY
jgi:hypothetical protein